MRTLLIWTKYFEMSFQSNDPSCFIENEWQQSVFVKAIEESADLMYLLVERISEQVQRICNCTITCMRSLTSILERTNTLLANMRDDDIYIEFVVDETSEIHDAQSVTSRLRVLMRLLPHFETYCSQGLYPVSGMDHREFDESQKKLKKEAIA